MGRTLDKQFGFDTGAVYLDVFFTPTYTHSST